MPVKKPEETMVKLASWSSCWHYDWMFKVVVIDGKHDQHCHSLKSTHTILLCSWKR